MDDEFIKVDLQSTRGYGIHARIKVNFGWNSEPEVDEQLKFASRNHKS